MAYSCIFKDKVMVNFYGLLDGGILGTRLRLWGYRILGWLQCTKIIVYVSHKLLK